MLGGTCIGMCGIKGIHGLPAAETSRLKGQDISVKGLSACLQGGRDTQASR